MQKRTPVMNVTPETHEAVSKYDCGGATDEQRRGDGDVNGMGLRVLFLNPPHHHRAASDWLNTNSQKQGIASTKMPCKM